MAWEIFVPDAPTTSTKTAPRCTIRKNSIYLGKNAISLASLVGPYAVYIDGDTVGLGAPVDGQFSAPIRTSRFGGILTAPGLAKRLGIDGETGRPYLLTAAESDSTVVAILSPFHEEPKKASAPAPAVQFPRHEYAHLTDRERIVRARNDAIGHRKAGGRLTIAFANSLQAKYHLDERQAHCAIRECREMLGGGDDA